MTQVNETETQKSDVQKTPFISFNLIGLETNQSRQRYIQEVYRIARDKIDEICSSLNLSRCFARDCFFMYKRIWRKLEPGKKSRAVRLLVPVVVYRMSRFRKTEINPEFLFQTSDCNETDFKEVFIDTYYLFPMRNRKKIVIEKLKRICNELNVSEKITKQALWFFIKHQPVLLSTTTSVAACASFIAPVLANGMKKRYPVYKIGKKFGASPSAITARIIRVLQAAGYEIDLVHKNIELIAMLENYFSKKCAV